MSSTPNHYSDPVPKQVAENSKFLTFRRRLLSKPHILSPKFRIFRLFTHTVTIGISAFIIFYADFGEKEHIFSPLRRFGKQKLDEYLTLTPEELNELKDKNQ